MRLRLLYHGHCFDGVASAATFTRFYRAHVRADAEVSYAPLLHTAGALFDETMFDGDENAIVDFKYSPSDKLTWWFDHHQSAFLTPRDEAHFREDTSGKKFWDPESRSCTEFIARVARERFGFEDESLAPRLDPKLADPTPLPIKGIQVRVLSAAGDVIDTPLPGAGRANPYCGAEAPAPADDTENARSVGVLVTYGRFRFLDLGDLTKKKELGLACPNNLIGGVDLFLVTHHGADLSNPKALVWALHPQVAVIDNGPRKGSSPAAWQIVHDAPGLEDLWQLHYAEESDKVHNVDADHIANVKEHCEGAFLKVLAESDGAYTLTNSRTGVTKSYSSREQDHPTQ